MYLCRVAYLNLAKLSTSSRLLRNVYRNGSIRQISSGGHSGSSGENMIYALIVGGVIGGGSLYTYKVLHNDKARYNDRIAEITERPKSERTPKEPQPKDEVQPPEVVEAGEEVSAENVEQPESPSAVEPNLEKSTVEEEVIEVLPLPTDDSQTPEEVEASGETLESTAVEVEVPAANIVEQVENLPTDVEPNTMPEEDEAEIPSAQAQ
ncbi:uncharacterized protein mgarpa isoform X2 [Rhinoraja longicauda]